ncbi:MAG: ABC transporter permease subunit [Betaproteobacteria bacterium]|nr:ABC transporter permease subunit [Betaproteobacteria bacterium]
MAFAFAGLLLVPLAAAALLWSLGGGLPVALWTDVLVYLLIAVVACAAWYTSRREHLRAPWRRVAHSRSGMAALVVLCAFVVVGVLDSWHFRPALETKDAKGKIVHGGEVLSLLDLVAAPLRASAERTYSAPFATRAYSRETVELADGKQTREFARLKYGGAHLASEASRGLDVLIRCLRGFAGAFLLWWVLAGAIAVSLARQGGVRAGVAWRAIWQGRTDVPWNVILLACGAVMALAGPVVTLGAHYHVLGTDKVGQDVLYLSLKSIRTGLVIGTLTTLVLLPLAVLLGIMAGYLRGWVDDVIQYLYTTLNSIPGVLLIAAAVLIMQVYIDGHPELFPTTAQRADLRLLFLCVILGLTSWTGLARLLRGETLKLRELEYIQAAQAFGVGGGRIIARHILPNVMHLVLIALVMDFSSLVLAEAVLSYVGVGVDPTMISFGTMINAARLEMSREPMVWWALFSAFAFMFALVLAANLFADAVRDAFDPRVRIRARSGPRRGDANAGGPLAEARRAAPPVRARRGVPPVGARTGAGAS